MVDVTVDGDPGISIIGLGDLSIPVISVYSENFIVDREYGGVGAIIGTVKRVATPSNVPLRRPVRLYDSFSGYLIRQTMSDAVTGIYSFTGLRKDIEYTVESYDTERSYRAVIADRLLAS